MVAKHEDSDRSNGLKEGAIRSSEQGTPVGAFIIMLSLLAIREAGAAGSRTARIN
jgi:hypothetical protein